MEGDFMKSFNYQILNLLFFTLVPLGLSANDQACAKFLDSEATSFVQVLEKINKHSVDVFDSLVFNLSDRQIERSVNTSIDRRTFKLASITLNGHEISLADFENVQVMLIITQGPKERDFRRFIFDVNLQIGSLRIPLAIDERANTPYNPNPDIFSDLTFSTIIQFPNQKRFLISLGVLSNLSPDLSIVGQNEIRLQINKLTFPLPTNTYNLDHLPILNVGN